MKCYAVWNYYEYESYDLNILVAMTISCYLLGEMSYARALSLKVTTFRGTMFLLSYTV